MEVEGRADADEHGGVEARAHPLHPLLLARDAEADPDHVGLLGVDLRGERVELRVGVLAEVLRGAADDPQAGVGEPEPARERGEGLGLVAAAVQVHAGAGARGARAGPPHELRAVDAVGQSWPSALSAQISG